MASIRQPVGTGWSHRPRGVRWPAVLAILALHGIALLAILRLAPEPEKPVEPAPLFVSFLTEPPAAQPAPLPSPPKPVVIPEKPAPKLIARKTPEPAAIKAAEPEPKPVEPAPPPNAAEVETAPAPPAAAPGEAPPAVIPPSFNAAYLDNPQPTYPPVSRSLGESGKVKLRVLVDAEGRAETVELAKSSGYDRLDRSALATVKTWRFVPARQGTQAVSAWVIVPINFNID